MNVVVFMFIFICTLSYSSLTSIVDLDYIV